MDNMYRSVLCVLGILSLPLCADVKLPVSSELVFAQSSQDPNVLFFNSEQRFKSGQYDDALKGFLQAASFGHEASVNNAKFMISKKMGIASNKSEVVSFLRYQASNTQSEDLMVNLFLADVYRGDPCIWSTEEPGSCDSQVSDVDYSQSYYFFSKASALGDQRAAYTVGMMDILGIGTGKNPALALSRFESAAEAGSPIAAYLAGSLLSGVSGILPSPDRSLYFFSMGAQSGHAPSMLSKADLLHRLGAQRADISMIQQSVSTYEDVMNGAFSSDLEKSNARYSLAMLLQGQPSVTSKLDVASLMMMNAKSQVKSESVARSLIWLGDKASATNMSEGAKFYAQSIDMLNTLPVSVHQRHATVYQKMAILYAKGDSSLDRDQLKYGFYMSRSRVVLSQLPEPKNEQGVFAGLHVFRYPGFSV